MLSWPGDARFDQARPALLVLGACLAWGVDNNLTRKVSLADATWVAMVKGLCAGLVNLAIALALGGRLSDAGTLVCAGVLGFFARAPCRGHGWRVRGDVSHSATPAKQRPGAAQHQVRRTRHDR